MFQFGTIVHEAHLLAELGAGEVVAGAADLVLAVDGLVRRGGEHEQLVPLAREQQRVHLDGQLEVEGQPFGPLHELVDDAVAYLAELLAQVRLVVHQLVEVLLETARARITRFVARGVGAQMAQYYTQILTCSVLISWNSSQSTRVWIIARLVSKGKARSRELLTALSSLCRKCTTCNSEQP